MEEEARQVADTGNLAGDLPTRRYSDRSACEKSAAAANKLTGKAQSQLEPWWVTLLREQQSNGFPDLAGTEASATIPISDRLISRVLARRLPASAPIRDLSVHAHDGEHITVRVRLTTPAILPPMQLRLAIEQQPDLPHSPVVVLSIVSQGLASLAANALRFVDVLPPGVQFDGRRFAVNLKTLLERYGAAEALSFLTDLKLTTLEGRIVVKVQGALPRGR